MEASKSEKPNLPQNNQQKGIDFHKLAAMHHSEAAKCHLQAAKFHENGDAGKSYEYAVKAQGHSLLAGECQSENFKQAALHQ